MILAIDAGNTRVKGYLVGPERVVPLFSLPTVPLLRKRGPLTRELERFEILMRGTEGGAVCSVVPDLDWRLAAAIRKSSGRRVLVIRHSCRFPFRVGVAVPRKVGGDRLCAAAGAVGARRSNAIVVDVGSAVTVDLVERRRFRGGLIMPGPALGLWALGEYTSRLPRLRESDLAEGIPGRFDDTESSMILGARAGTAGGIVAGVRVLRRASRSTGDVFVTGGGAALVVPRLPKTWRWDPHLVPKGILRVWELNRRA